MTKGETVYIAVVLESDTMPIAIVFSK